jgi:hypothetical protein
VKYRFSPNARVDLLAAAQYYDSRRDGLGAEFAVDVGLAIAQILEAPKRWAEIEPGVRKFSLDRFPFALIYRTPRRGMIDIVAVFDLRREPGSWRTE